jgi:hypothetical protein
MPAEAVAEMNRDFPAYLEEMDPRGVRLYGRELDEHDRAVTVRVRDGETLVTDGPFAETKEFVGGFDLLGIEEYIGSIDGVSGGDRQRAIDLAASHPFARYYAVEAPVLRHGHPRQAATRSAVVTTPDVQQAVDAAFREAPQSETDEETMRELFDETEEIDNDRLRLIFTCCHPALEREGRVATLRTLAGLTMAEIAKAFWSPRRRARWR